MHNDTTIYRGENVYGPLKRGTHVNNIFTDVNQLKPMIKIIAEVDMI